MAQDKGLARGYSAINAVAEGIRILGSCVSCAGALERREAYKFKTEQFQRIYRDASIYVCKDCGLIQTDISKVDEAGLAEYYRVDYRAHGIGGADRLDLYLPRAEGLLALALEEYDGEPERIFEVGAGHGLNLEAFARRFPEAQLFTDEPDQTVQLDAKIERSTLSDGNYDVIIISHVLEHVTDPHALLRAALDALRPEGLIVVEVPNETDATRSTALHFEPHLIFFRPETLANICTRAGSVAKIGTVGPPIHRPSAARRLARHLLAPIRRRKASNRKPLDVSSATRNGRFIRATIKTAPAC